MRLTSKLRELATKLATHFHLVHFLKMADNMVEYKIQINKDYAKKLHKQKEKAELDNCKFKCLEYFARGISLSYVCRFWSPIFV